MPAAHTNAWNLDNDHLSRATNESSYEASVKRNSAKREENAFLFQQQDQSPSVLPNDEMHVTVEKLTPPVTSSTYVSPKFMSSESNESHEAELHSPASSLETYGSKSAIFPQQTHPVITGLSPLYEQPETGLLTTSSSTSSNGLSVMVTTGKTVVVTTATTCSPGSKKSINSSNGNVKSISDVVYEDRMETAWKDSLETTRSRMSFERKQRNTKV